MHYNRSSGAIQASGEVFSHDRSTSAKLLTIISERTKSGLIKVRSFDNNTDENVKVVISGSSAADGAGLKPGGLSVRSTAG